MSIAVKINTESNADTKSRKAATSDHPSVFTDFFQEDTNIAIWRRELSADVKTCTRSLLAGNDNFRISLVTTSDNVITHLNESSSELKNSQALCEDIAELTDMFCLLFGVKQVGLRLTALDRAMCPRFHTDNVRCRLICTYQGMATEWLPHHLVNRGKLGRGNNGLADEKSGLFQNINDIQQLQAGHVALLKGELWKDNEKRGVSTSFAAGAQRRKSTINDT